MLAAGRWISVRVYLCYRFCATLCICVWVCLPQFGLREDRMPACVCRCNRALYLNTIVRCWCLSECVCECVRLFMLQLSDYVPCTYAALSFLRQQLWCAMCEILCVRVYACFCVWTDYWSTILKLIQNHHIASSTRHLQAAVKPWQRGATAGRTEAQLSCDVAVTVWCRRSWGMYCGCENNFA